MCGGGEVEVQPSIPYPWDWGQIGSLKFKVQTSIPNPWEWRHAQSMLQGIGGENPGASHPYPILGLGAGTNVTE